MKRVLVIAVAVLLVGASSAAAKPVLSGHQARTAIRSWSLSRGMERTEVKRCKRVSTVRLDCIAVETGWWSEGVWAQGVHSWFEAREAAVVWLGFVWGESCTDTPGLEPQCSA